VKSRGLAKNVDTLSGQTCEFLNVIANSTYSYHCATDGKVAGSIPARVIRIFHSFNPSGRTVALGWT
jgi:hypothetical protein